MSYLYVLRCEKHFFQIFLQSFFLAYYWVELLQEEVVFILLYVVNLYHCLSICFSIFFPSIFLLYSYQHDEGNSKTLKLRQCLFFVDLIYKRASLEKFDRKQSLSKISMSKALNKLQKTHNVISSLLSMQNNQVYYMVEKKPSRFVLFQNGFDSSMFCFEKDFINERFIHYWFD